MTSLPDELDPKSLVALRVGTPDPVTLQFDATRPQFPRQAATSTPSNMGVHMVGDLGVSVPIRVELVSPPKTLDTTIANGVELSNDGALATEIRRNRSTPRLARSERPPSPMEETSENGRAAVRSGFQHTYLLSAGHLVRGRCRRPGGIRRARRCTHEA